MLQKKITTGKTSDTGELRRQAEAKFIERKNKTGPLPELESEARRLVHELQVHQIELEVQNEELKQAQVELEAALDQYTNLYDFAPVGYFTLARDGQIQKANLAGAKLLGTERSQVVSRRFGLFVSEESRPLFTAFLEKVFEDSGQETCEVALLQGDSELWVSIEGAYSNASDECSLVAMDITKLKQTNKLLQNSQDHLRLVIQSANVGLWDWDLVTNEVYFSLEYKKQLGYDDSEVLDESSEWERLVHPEDLEGALKKVNGFIEKPYPNYNNEFRMRHKDGSYRWILAQASLAHDQQGIPIRMMGSHIDITELKQAENELRENETRLRVAIETIDVAVFGQDTDLRYTWMYQPQLGYTADQVVGKTDAELMPQQDAEIIMQIKKRALDSGKRMREEAFVHLADQTMVYDLTVEPVRDAAGKVTGLVGATLDITERKQAQEEIARANQLLEETGRLGKIGGWALDLNTMEMYFSAETFRIHDLPGPTPPNLEDAINFYAPESQPVIQLALKNAIEKHIPYDHELPFITAKGQNLWVRAQGHVEVENSQAVRLYGSFQDITEHKMAEKIIQNHTAELENRVQERTQELNKAIMGLEHANRTKDEFFANMSHELRTPLNSILGFSESLLEQMRGPLNVKQKQYIGLINSSGQHLLGLINDILLISKIDAEKLVIDSEVISVKDVCESSLSFIKDIAVKKAISIEFKNEQAISSLRADPRRVKQILVNLLSNAVKFTPEKGEILLEVSTNAEEDQIHFSVTDNGIGIAPENLPKLFTPFTQLDSSLSRQHEGTGLGLMLILKLTKLHGGSVKVESEPGKGSRFTVILPWVGFNPMMENPVPLASLKTIVDNKTFSSRSVLLVEDSESNVLTIEEYLSDHGHKVAVAHNGIEAIAMTEKLSPDIILMDIQMPKMDGLEAIQRLRAMPKFVSVPIIALTALAMPGDRERCLSVGANEYMSKPVSLKLLMKTIDDLVGSEN